MWWRNGTPEQDRLNAYWDAAVGGAASDASTQAAPDLDPNLLDTVTRARLLHRRHRPDPAFALQLETTLMNAFATTYPKSTVMQPVQPKRLVTRPIWQPRREEIFPRKWNLAALATIALIAVTLAAFFFLIPDTRHPAIAPGTPEASPTAIPAPTAAAMSESLILFQGSEPTNNSARLYTMNLDGSNVQEVTHDADGWSQHPDWSSDGQSIVFIKDTVNGIWSMDADGANQKLLFTCATECNFADFPVWSSDGSRVAFPGYFALDEGPPQTSVLLVLDVATGKTRIVAQAQLPLVVDTPQWSPDDSTIVLAVNKYDESGAQTGSALATVPSAGGELTYLTDFDSFAYYPTWNAQTNQIAFSTETYLNSTITDIYAKAWNLYTINPDGTSLTRLTDVDAGVHMMQPSWTPDGEKLLATAESGGNLVASWVDPATGDVTAITTGGRQTSVQLQPSSTGGSAGTGDPDTVQAQTAVPDDDESAMSSADDTPVADPADWVPHSSGRPW